MPPDTIISPRLPKPGKGAPLTPLKLPASFRASSERILGDLTLERLGRLTPETEMPVAIGCLEDASLLLSLHRSFQGITASGHWDLIPLFDAVLQGPLPKEEALRLDGMLEAEKGPIWAYSEAHSKAQRVKGAYHLSKAAAMRLR